MTTAKAKVRKPIRKARKANAGTKSTAPEILSDPVDKFIAIENAINGAIVGREQLTRGIIISLIASQNVLALGVPGTAKTMLVQAIASAFAGKDDVFDILLTKYTKANEVFGPTDIPSLEQGQLKTNTDGYLPSATVGSIDEIFKGSSAILNSLLRIANERTFRNGTKIEQTSVRMLVGMSNEFPEDPALLAAFYDRFPCKYMVNYLDSDDFASMLDKVSQGVAYASPCKLTDADFDEIDLRMSKVNLPKEIIETLAEIRAELQVKGVVISDRRWVQATKIMSAHAVYNGRSVVSRRDLCVLESIAWNTDTDQQYIASILPQYLNPFEADLRTVTDEAYAARQSILDAANADGSDSQRPVPDMANAATAASKAWVTIKGQEAKLELLADLVEDESDEALLEQGRDSIEAVREAVQLIVKGQDGIQQLIDSEKEDI